MNVESSTDGSIQIYKIDGDVDMKTSRVLREKLQAGLKSKPKAILVDMSGCPYIDSSGIATLVETLQGLRAWSGKLAIAGTCQRVKDIFEIAHLDGIFPMFATTEDAKASFTS